MNEIPKRTLLLHVLPVPWVKVYHWILKPETSMISVPIREITIRLVAHDEVACWQELMARHHYLGFPGFLGERLYQVAEWKDQWVRLEVAASGGHPDEFEICLSQAVGST